jgi:hypothetical protein
MTSAPPYPQSHFTVHWTANCCFSIGREKQYFAVVTFGTSIPPPPTLSRQLEQTSSARDIEERKGKRGVKVEGHTFHDSCERVVLLDPKKTTAKESVGLFI